MCLRQTRYWGHGQLCGGHFTLEVSYNFKKWITATKMVQKAWFIDRPWKTHSTLETNIIFRRFFVLWGLGKRSLRGKLLSQSSFPFDWVAPTVAHSRDQVPSVQVVTMTPVIRSLVSRWSLWPQECPSSWLLTQARPLSSGHSGCLTFL